LRLRACCEAESFEHACGQRQDVYDVNTINGSITSIASTSPALVLVY